MSIKDWFNPATSLKALWPAHLLGFTGTTALRIEGINRLFSGRLNAPWSQKHPRDKNHFGLVDIPSLGLLYLLESFLRGNWIKNQTYARRFRYACAVFWVPLHAIRIALNVAAVAAVAAVVVAAAAVVIAAAVTVVLPVLPFVGIAKWRNKKSATSNTHILTKNAAGELDFSTLDNLNSPLIAPEDRIWIIQQEQGEFKAELHNRRMTNLDSCSKIIVKSDEQPARVRNAIYQWDIEDDRPFPIKPDRSPYFVLWKKRTDAAIQHGFGRENAEEIGPDRFCYQQG